jgi:hypothetical protein
MQQPAEALTLQFLAWVDERPRSYAEAMDAWRSTCPRLSIWEDAVRGGLIAFERSEETTMKDSKVALTARSRALLDGRA